MDWEPFRADHSIEKANITLSFASRLEGDLFDDLLIVLRKSAQGLHLTNRVEISEALQLTPGADGVITMDLTKGPPSSSRRVIFQRLNPERVAIDEVSLGAQGLILGTVFYRRWVEFFEMLKKILTDLNHVTPVVDLVSKVKLEYWDRFQSTNSTANQFELLRENSSLLVGAVRGKHDAFHVHSGWFDFEGATVRLLTNVNVDTNTVAIREGNNDPIRRNITILTLGQAESLKGTLDKPLERLDNIHTHLKLTFRDIITDAAARRINL
jgi:uncharacterized protein (TIGR04255 family)